jgi:PKD repeat protein
MYKKTQVISNCLLMVLCLSTILLSSTIEILPDHRVNGESRALHEDFLQSTTTQLVTYDTLANKFEGPFYFLSTNDQTLTNATKLTPKSNCSLKYLLFDFYNGDNISKSKICNFYVWKDNSGKPGELAATIRGEIKLDNGWWTLSFNVADKNLVFDKSFWIGRKEETTGFPTAIFDSTGTPGANAISANGVDWASVNVDFIQQAVVTYDQTETVSTPNTPTGPSQDKVGHVVTFTTGGSACSLGHPVEYQFDWGDSQTSTWGAAEQSHTFASGASFNVKARARCKTNTGVLSGWSAQKTVQISYCNLTVSTQPANAGSVAKSPDKSNFSFGESVTLTANAGDGYDFDHWDGKLSGNSNPAVLLMNEDKQVTAVFSAHGTIIADFSANPTSGPVPLDVQFTDKSSGTITSRHWTFGDGGESTDTNPTHQYTQAGSYTVTLEISGPYGNSTKTRENYIVAAAANVPILSYTPDTLIFNYQPTNAVLAHSSNFSLPSNIFISAKSVDIKLKNTNGSAPMSVLQADNFDTLGNSLEAPVLYLKDQYQTYTKATKLVPASQCAIKSLIFWLLNDDPNDKKAKNFTFYVWQDKDGLPGVTLFSKSYNVKLDPGGWPVPFDDVASANIILDKTFWIGSKEEAAGFPTAIIDSVGTPGANFWAQDGIQWQDFPFDFCQQAVVQYGAPPVAEIVETLTIHNSGAAQLEVASIYADVPWISAISERAFTIDPGGTKEITVTANPDNRASGKYIGNISIISNDPARLICKVPTVLSITGVVPKIEAAPKVIFLSRMKDGASILSADLTIKNTGNGVLSGSVVQPDSAWLQALENNVFSISAHGSKTFTVKINEQVRMPDGEYTATITINSNDPNNPKVEIPVVYLITAVKEKDAEVPAAYRLDSNYPNPFNPVTSIAFTVPRPEHVVIEIYDTLGKKILKLVDNDFSAGQHSVTWDAGQMTSGTYFYYMKAGSFSNKKKCLLLK